ncbi:MAG: alpha/beta hydrolase [Verrucomicrobiota bacterium]|nr:alpha/beta hydrolase [Verrucomicrobiota bacterium]
MKRKILFALALLAVYWAVLSLSPLPDRLILFPTTERIDPAGATRKAVAFAGGEVEIWRAASNRARSSGRPDFYVLRFYGNADRAEYWPAEEAEMWNGRAVEVWGVNYPGFGGSTGPTRLAQLGPAGLAAFDALQQVAQERPIVVFGTSLGTTVALHIAAQRPLAGLILQNPPPIREMIHRQFGWWNLGLLTGPLARKIPADLDSIANARAARGRAIFLLAEADEVVAPRFQALVVAAYGGEKRLIHLPEAEHNSPLDDPGLTKLNQAMDWLLGRVAPTDIAP